MSEKEAPTAATDAVTAALKETLERTGDLDAVRARLRAAVLRSMDDARQEAAIAPNRTEPPLENVIINELIADYLSFNGFDQTLSVFAAESQATDANRGRLGEMFIRSELGLSRDSSLAMLYDVVEAMKRRWGRRCPPGSKSGT